MEYNYNNTMTISTSGPKNEMNARWGAAKYVGRKGFGV